VLLAVAALASVETETSFQGATYQIWESKGYRPDWESSAAAAVGVVLLLLVLVLVSAVEVPSAMTAAAAA
jgi:hypothetical protein